MRRAAQSTLAPLAPRALVAVAALSVALLAAAGAGAHTRSSGRLVGASSNTPSCAISGLVAWIDTQGSGAAGSVTYRLELTNLSGHTCTLTGYPRVAAVDLGGHQLGSGSGRYVSRAPLVTLTRLATASVVLEIVDVNNFSAGVCRPVTAAGLRFFPPHQNASKVIPFPFGACSRSGPGYLWAKAVRHGS